VFIGTVSEDIRVHFQLSILLGRMLLNVLPSDGLMRQMSFLPSFYPILHAIRPLLTNEAWKSIHGGITITSDVDEGSLITYSLHGVGHYLKS
jgi:hypothetical protein